jgi:ribosomal protein S18 acetylase RimI-like enzyme
MWANLPAGSADSEIVRVGQHFQAHKLPALWWVWPSSQPDDLADRLTAHGWTLTGDAPGMAIDLQQLPPKTQAIESLEIAHVTTSDLLRQWQRLLTVSFELPDKLGALFHDLCTHLGFDERAIWQNYVGLLDGQPVACASLILGASVAGIFNIATLPEARGKGIGTAITYHALIEAQTKGYGLAILESSTMGYHIYQRLGFKDYFKIAHYLFSPVD